MSRNFVILTGKRFGRLLVTGEPIRKNKITKYKCLCDCGKTTLVAQGSLNTENLKNATRSCGCKKFTHKDLTGKRFNNFLVKKRMGRNYDKRHTYKCLCDCGETVIVTAENLKARVNSCMCRYSHTGVTTNNPNLYSIWRHINLRCFDIYDASYDSYGGRGITVCYRWSYKNKKGFLNFLKDFKDIYVPNSGLSFDRIDNNKSYTPNNIRLADAKTQSNNRRDNRKILLSKKIISMMDFSDLLDKPYNTIRWHLLKKEPSTLIKYYYERGKIDSKTYEGTKDAVWYLGS